MAQRRSTSVDSDESGSRATEQAAPEEQAAEQPPKAPDAEQPSGGFDPGHVLTAITLITVGIFLLLNNLGVLPWDLWRVVWRFWPVALMMAGFALVAGKSVLSRWVVIVVGLIVLAAVFVTAVASTSSGAGDALRRVVPWWPVVSDSGIGTGDELAGEVVVVTSSEFDAAQDRRLEVDVGVGKLVMDDTQGDDLLRVVSGEGGRTHVQRGLDGETVVLQVESGGGPWFFGGGGSRYHRTVTLGRTDLPTDLQLHLGAGEGEVVFDQLQLSHLDAEVGAGRLAVRLSEEALPDEARLDVGSGEVRLVLPAEAGVRITHDVGLGRLTIDGQRIDDDGTYQSPNFDEAEQTVVIDVHVGVGSVTIEHE